MAQCPNCSAPVADDFGLTECASCNAQLLVHIDGTVEFSGAGGDASGDGGEEPYVAPEVNLDENAPYEELAYQEDVPTAEEEPAEPYEAEPTSEDESEFEAAPEHPEPEYDFDAPEPAPDAPLASPANASPDLSDIAQFGNSEESGGRDGALRYNVLISGIDTSDVRDAFREALTDRKFLWDTDQILRSIRDGECKIANVSAVKAHVLIARLRQIQVNVAWEQYAVHQA